jgi:DNA-binding transcriptional LysR family regulator
MRHQEISLLVIFDAIMTEGSITRAADRLELTQPAVSNALSRMRQAWNDELFIKDGRNIQPTIYAQNLWKRVRNPLMELEDAVDVEGFDPASSQRTFRIAAADAIIDTAWAPLRKIIEEQAPNINVHAVPYTISNATDLLDNAEVDLVVGVLLDNNETICSEYLYSPCYICVMRPDHPLTQADFTLEDFANSDHLLVSLSGEASGYTDEVLAQHGLSRRIAMTVNHFSAVPKLISQSDLIAIVPSSTMEEAIFSGQLAVVEPPTDINSLQINNYWHRRQDTDKGLTWLRSHITRIIKQHAEQHMEELEKRICNKCQG